MLQPKIKLTSEEMKYMALFESITGATTQDCIIDEKLERIIFVAKQGDMGLAIGKGGKNINTLRRMTSRQIEVVEYADTPEALIKNSLAPARLKEIRVTERPDKKIVVVENVQRWLDEGQSPRDAAFRAMNDVEFPVQQVLDGIDAAAAAGLPVKDNAVVKRGANDEGIVGLAEHFRGSGHTLRFKRMTGKLEHSG